MREPGGKRELLARYPRPSGPIGEHRDRPDRAPAARRLVPKRIRLSRVAAIGVNPRCRCFAKAPEAVVVLVAGGASLEVRTHARDRLVRILAGKLQLDISIELLEALLAAQLGPSGPSSARSSVVIVASVMLPPFLPRRCSFHERRGTRAASGARREASCTALPASC